MEPSTLLLLVAAFVAGLVDAAVGGGGLIQVPALFVGLPSTTPATLLGTNKFASIFGTGSAAWRFARQLSLPWSLLGGMVVLAFVFALLGAAVASQMPTSWMRPLVLVLLLAVLGYTLRRREFGQEARVQAGFSRRERGVGALLAAAIGFYDGFFGPGTGSFLLFGFVRFFRFDFLQASALAKVINLTTNLAALAYFVPTGHVWYALAIPMALCNVLGAQVGASLALRGGARLIRPLFILLVTCLCLKLAIDILGTLS